jgi:type IVB pilus formation R64 PilN family outer membrane protein
MNMRSLSLSGLICVLLSSCAFDTALRTDVDKRVDTVTAEAAAPVGSDVVFRRLDYPWLGDETVSYNPNPADQPPASLDMVVQIDNSQPMDLATLAGLLQEAAGVPIDLAPDTRTLPKGAAENVRAVALQPVTLVTQATVRRYLDFATAQTETHWVYERGRIVIARLMSKTFSLPTLPVASKLAGTISNATTAGGESGGGQGGGDQASGGGAGGLTGQASSVQANAATQQTSSSDTTLDPTKDLMAALEQMKGPEGAIAVSPALGTVTVRDTPANVRSIETFLVEMGERLSRFVSVDVMIASVQLNDSNSTGIDFNLIRGAAGDFYGVGLGGGGLSDIASVRGGVTVIDPRSPYADSAILIDALRQQGRVSIDRRYTMTTLNNQIASIQNAVERGAVLSTTQTAVPDVGLITSGTVSRLPTGVSLDVLPVILQDQRIIMHIQGTLSKQDGTETLGTGTNTFNSPIISTSAFSRRAAVPSGGTLVLSSIDETTLSDTQDGVGNPGFRLFGGSRKTSRERRVLMILITPRVID